MSVLSKAIALLLFQSYLVQAEDAVPLRFCFEDKQLLPHYAGKGTQVANPPGSTIEQLQAALKNIPQLKLQLQRKPWLRCLQLLEQNRVDAIVANFSESRSSFVVYPMKPENTPDTERAMSRYGSCLVLRQNDDVGNRSISDLVFARPLGYLMPGYPEHATILPVESQQKAFELVQQGRVDATLTLCEANQMALSHDVAEGLQIVYPPLHQATGYLVYSKVFYQNHANLASALWLELPKHRDPSRYQRYLQKPQ